MRENCQIHGPDSSVARRHVPRCVGSACHRTPSPPPWNRWPTWPPPSSATLDPPGARTNAPNAIRDRWACWAPRCVQRSNPPPLLRAQQATRGMNSRANPSKTGRSGRPAWPCSCPSTPGPRRAARSCNSPAPRPTSRSTTPASLQRQIEADSQVALSAVNVRGDALGTLPNRAHQFEHLRRDVGFVVRMDVMIDAGAWQIAHSATCASSVSCTSITVPDAFRDSHRMRCDSSDMSSNSGCQRCVVGMMQSASRTGQPRSDLSGVVNTSPRMD